MPLAGWYPTMYCAGMRGHVALRMNRSTAELWINGEKVASRRSRWTPSIVNSLRMGERRGGRVSGHRLDF